jgi:hypothetical protein
MKWLMSEALGYTNEIRLNLADKYNEASVEVNVKNYAAWSKVNELGFLNRG